MYKISEDKDISIRSVLRLMTESAFDCALNYFRNHIDGTEGTRECDYMSCDYKCDGVNMSMIKNGLDDQSIDYSYISVILCQSKDSTDS